MAEEELPTSPSAFSDLLTTEIADLNASSLPPTPSNVALPTESEEEASRSHLIAIGDGFLQFIADGIWNETFQAYLDEAS